MMEKKFPHDDMDREAAELEALSLRVSWGLRRRLQQQLDSFSLTLPQYMAMNTLYRQENGCSMSELAESTHQLSPTMTGIIDRLVERGLVARERAASDRRAMRVTLSQEGREVIGRINALKRGWTRRFLEELSPEEREMVKMVLGRFLDNIGAAQTVEPAKQEVGDIEEIAVGD